MLPLKTIEEVKRLLDEKCYSQRRIAKLTGVGRGTVHAIASGKRSVHGREADPDIAPHEHPLPVRCPGCGARVYLPCVLCRARDYNLRRQLSSLLAADSSKRVA